MNKNILRITSGVLIVGLLAGCTPATPPSPTQTTEPMNASPYIEQVKSMDEETYISYIQEYANSAKPRNILYSIVDSRKDLMNDKNHELIRQTEWVSTVFNIAKYQDLIGVYDYGLVYNDDDSFNYEETVKKIGDGLFEKIYESMTKDGFKVMRRNDALYVTTDVPAFLERAGDVSENFKGYLNIVNEIDNNHFIREGKVNYDNLVHCMTFADNYLKTYTDDIIWETVYQQFYYQTMMYVGLYGVGGFMNEDGSYNPDFETRVSEDIKANQNTLFADIMQRTLEGVKNQSTGEWNSNTLQLTLDDCINEVMDQYWLDFYKNTDPDTYNELIEQAQSSQEGIVITDTNS